MNILIAGYQHETNTFAPSLADWAAFCRGDSFPAYQRGIAMQQALAPVNLPMGGFIQAAQQRGWNLIPSLWAGAIPSSYVTSEAFERIANEVCDDVRQALPTGLDAAVKAVLDAAGVDFLNAPGSLKRDVRDCLKANLPA